MFVVSYYAAFAAIAAVLALLAAPLLVLGLGAWGPGLAEWTASMVLELWIVAAMALFAAISIESATAAVIVTVAFYALGRTADFFLAAAHAGTAPSDSAALDTISHGIIAIISAVMPRLDLFGQSRWLVYGPAAAGGSSGQVVTKVLKDSYGAEKQQHTFTMEVNLE